MKPRIAITVGDPAGIGPEIVARAVRDARVLAACDPIVIGDPVAFRRHRQALPSTEMLSTPGLRERFAIGRPSREAGTSAMESVRQGAALVQMGQAVALVTAPASKISFQLAGLPHPGHTEWLLKDYGNGQGAMLMVAGPLRALLMTRHIPLASVAHQLSIRLIQDAARYAHAFARQVLKKARPRLVLCGLNPHAGDGGLLGGEEETIFAPALRELKRRGLAVKGPLPADSVYRDMAAGHYDIALAPYHDQGMIPLKLYAPDRLVNITLGLPFIRTSPGHGTAYDIAGKQRADPRPMIEAIVLAAQYSQRERVP